MSPAHERDWPSPRAAYVHIPFCISKCHYCDFNSYPGMHDLFDSYVQAVATEIHRDSGGPLESIYFGGGTPTLLTSEQLGKLLTGLRDRFGLADDCETTVEANPGTVDEHKFAQLLATGFNRLSLGVQSFDDGYLSRIGRAHTAAQALEAYRTARDTGFANVSIDLIFALPGQTLHEWVSTLERAVLLAPEHISAYELTVEEGTRFGEMCARGEFGPVDEDLRIEMFETTIRELAAAGYEHYEVSNYARPGFRSRHNLAYWHNEPYRAFGAGATSYVEGVRSKRVTDPAEYIGRVLSGSDAIESSERLDDRRRMGETVIVGLRMLNGVDLHKLSTEFCANLETEFAEQLRDLTARGLVEVTSGRLRVTHKGLLLLDDVAAEFV